MNDCGPSLTEGSGRIPRLKPRKIQLFLFLGECELARPVSRPVARPMARSSLSSLLELAMNGQSEGERGAFMEISAYPYLRKGRW